MVPFCDLFIEQPPPNFAFSALFHSYGTEIEERTDRLAMHATGITSKLHKRHHCH